MSRVEYKKTYKRVMDDINRLNDVLLSPDPMAWGEMTREEADDYFNWDSDEQEWGRKSEEMLLWIRDDDDW